MRIPVIAGNWKMNLDRARAVGLAGALRERASGPAGAAVELAVAPPFPYLEAVAQALRGSPVRLAAQNVHSEPYGAFTGDVSGAMLKDVGCSHVIVGHSERRHSSESNGESNELVGRKLQAALAAGLAPILCVGETLAERQAKRGAAVVLDQLDAALRGRGESELGSLIVAYEPVWAIGTGVNATPEQAGEMHRLIRDRLATRIAPAVADRTRILYGGSVKPENAAELLAVEHVDGALVGGASLTAASFLSIVDACPKRAQRSVPK